MARGQSSAHASADLRKDKPMIFSSQPDDFLFEDMLSCLDAQNNSYRAKRMESDFRLKMLVGYQQGKADDYIVQAEFFEAQVVESAEFAQKFILENGQAEETILAITEVSNLDLGVSHASFDGYRIQTSDQEILVVIDNGHQCCENWGYEATDSAPFVGSLIKSIMLSTWLLAPYQPGSESEWAGLDIVTNRGTWQAVVFNEHNGYYGHAAKIISKQVTFDESL